MAQFKTQKFTFFAPRTVIFFVKSLHLFQLFYMNNTVLSFTLHLSPVDNQRAKGEGSNFHLLFWMAAISRSVFSSVVAQLVQMRTAV